MVIGYARVSTEDQNLTLQLNALKAAGCVRIYSDHGVSGSKASRPGLDQAMRRLRPGGKLVVWRLDRLGRSLIHLVRLLDQLGKRHVSFHSVTEHIDTASSGGRLVFHMMAALAEFERELISERTKAGMKAARSQGKRLGRLPSLTPQQCLEARHLRKYANWSLNEVAEQYSIHPRTLSRLTTYCSLDKIPVSGGPNIPTHLRCERCKGLSHLTHCVSTTGKEPMKILSISDCSDGTLSFVHDEKSLAVCGDPILLA